jgi:hypothetical protein
MPVAGGPKITKTGLLLEVDVADKTSYSGTGTTWINQVRPGSFNGTLNNISFNSTDAKGALVFTGSNTFVDFGNLGPSLTSSFSFQVAFKPTATASGQPYTILSYASASATSSITFKLDYTSSNQTVILSAFSNTGSQNIVYAISGSVTPGTWNIINGTYGTNVLALFKNGNLITSTPTTGSTVGYNSNNKLYLGGTYGLDSGFYTGSVASLTINQADLDIRAVANNYNAFFSRFGLTKTPGLVTDFDAINFIEAVGLNNETQAVAINDLVLGLKANNLWDKMQAIYPFVGGTAYSHKFNLKDPRDSDAAFRIQYVGVVNHSSLGISGSGYADTYYNPLTDSSEFATSMHASIYTTTTNNYISKPFPGTIMGNTGDGAGLSITPNYRNGGPSYYQLYFPTWKSLGGASTSDVGFYIASRTSATDVAFYRRINTGNTSTSATQTYNASSNGSIKILNANFDGWNGNVGFSSLGYGLSTTDSINLDTVVSAYQTALGRKPF